MKAEKSLSILIIGRIYQQNEIFNLTKKAVSKFIAEIPCTFYFMDQNTLKKIVQALTIKSCQIFNRNEHADVIDYVVTIGGDGTILYAAKQFLKATPPFLTFQKGTLGFLCKFSVQQMQYTIQKVAQLKKSEQSQKKLTFPFQQCKLMRLTIKTKKLGLQPNQKDTRAVLNQVAITRKKCTRIILEIFINDQFITTTSGDGILVSTPTGSTAYALSAGGPVVLNGVNTIVLLPLAPNSLSFRPICIPNNSVVRIRMSEKSRSQGIISFDGQSSIQLNNGDQIQIKHEKSTQAQNQTSNDLILLQPKSNPSSSSQDKQGVQNTMPTWMARLKHFLGWNEVFKSPVCQLVNKSIPKISIPEEELLVLEQTDNSNTNSNSNSKANN